ncbi:MAG: nucleotidyltransferase domain-containing protein [Deltaproteobacteria bacterium]|nr:nucleotidyltransferase domain-containing protein [Deltaproteobacteria bacterium]
MVFKPLLTRNEIRKVAAELRAVLKKAGIQRPRLILFGSYAKGRPRPWSDIDLCVVSKQFGRDDFAEMARLSILAKRVSYLLEVHPLHPQDLQRGLHPLADEIKRTGVTL